MKRQQVRQKYSSFKNVNGLFVYFYKTINWLCQNFRKDKKICEILIWSANGQKNILQLFLKLMNFFRFLEVFQDKECSKFCWVHKFFWEYYWTFLNRFMTNAKRKAFRRRLFFKFENESDFEYYFDIFDYMKDNFINEEIRSWSWKKYFMIENWYFFLFI